MPSAVNQRGNMAWRRSVEGADRGAHEVKHKYSRLDVTETIQKKPTAKKPNRGYRPQGHPHDRAVGEVAAADQSESRWNRERRAFKAEQAPRSGHMVEEPAGRRYLHRGADVWRMTRADEQCGSRGCSQRRASFCGGASGAGRWSWVCCQDGNSSESLAPIPSSRCGA